MSNAFLHKQHFCTGKKNAKVSTLAVCLLARDCQKYLPKTLRTLERLSAYFAHVEFFIAENDSADATPNILTQWCNNDTPRRHSVNVHAYVAQHLPTAFASKSTNSNAGNDAFTREYDASLEHAHMRRRTMRIAAVRDSALHAIKNSATQFDYVLMLDADVVSLSVRGIISSFSDHLPSWDVLTANGRSFYFYMNILPFIGDAHYDTFAVQRIYEEARPFNRNIEFRRELSLLRKHSMPFPVHSAFGGMGLYKYAALKNTSYFAAAQEDDFQFCEHVSFHKGLRSLGFCKVFINPAMLLYYNSMMRAFVSGFVKHVFGKAFHRACKKVFSKKQ